MCGSFSDDGMNTWVDPAERLDMQCSAAKERFGQAVQPRPKTLAGLWAAVAKATKDPVALEVPAMLIGLHYKFSDGLILRTEPWAPTVSATSEGRTAQLSPGVPAGLVATGELASRSMEPPCAFRYLRLPSCPSGEVTHRRVFECSRAKHRR